MFRRGLTLGDRTKPVLRQRWTYRERIRLEAMCFLATRSRTKSQGRVGKKGLGKGEGGRAHLLRTKLGVSLVRTSASRCASSSIVVRFGKGSPIVARFGDTPTRIIFYERRSLHDRCHPDRKVIKGRSSLPELTASDHLECQGSRPAPVFRDYR